MNHEDIIKSFGFYTSGSCDCGGVRNDKYRNGPFIIYIRKTKNQFKIKKKNEVIVPLKSLNELEKALQETFPKQVAGQSV
jgi:hypothetical protein